MQKHDIRMSFPQFDPNRFQPFEHLRDYPKQMTAGVVKNGVQVDPGVIVHSKMEEEAWLAAQASKDSGTSKTADDGAMEIVKRGPGRPPKVSELA